MNIILLSGGSGKRLWPLSNDIRSKQFIKLFRREDGTYESMLQRMYRMLREVDPSAEITVATSKTQISAIHNQIGEAAGISLEPARRDTFPAIALAALYLRDVRKVPDSEAVIVCPVDPYVDSSYFRTFPVLTEIVGSGGANLALLGMEPTYPSAKYGYIMPETRERISSVRSFKEKPDEKTAAEYIAQGALWNGGVFGFRISYVADIAEKLLGAPDYRTLFARYVDVERISFDIAVAEREKSIKVLRFSGIWKDLGTWNTLTEAMEENIGEAVLNESCENVHVINELNVPVLCMGLKDTVVAASPEGILVSDKAQSSYIKPFVDSLDTRVMFAEKSWGSFRIIDIEEDSLTICVSLNPGHGMNYHSHTHRDEVWTVVSGTGRVILDEKESLVSAGDVIRMPAGVRHTVIAETALRIIEVQIGREISVTDKIKHPMPF